MDINSQSVYFKIYVIHPGKFEFFNFFSECGVWFTCNGFIDTCEQKELLICFRYTVMVGGTKYCSFLFIVSSSIQSLGLWYWGKKIKFIVVIYVEVNMWFV